VSESRRRRLGSDVPNSTSPELTMRSGAFGLSSISVGSFRSLRSFSVSTRDWLMER